MDEYEMIILNLIINARFHKWLAENPDRTDGTNIMNASLFRQNIYDFAHRFSDEAKMGATFLTDYDPVQVTTKDELANALLDHV